MAQRTRSNWHYVRSIIGQTWRHPSNRHRRLGAVWSAATWQIVKRVRRRPRDVDFFGFRLRCHPDSNSASNVVYFTERYDVDEMGFMERYLRDGDGFVDVGANIGTYSLLARRLVGPAGRVVAFEPHPVAALRLRENIALNRLDNVEVHEAAVADVAGEAEFLEDYDVSNRILSVTDRGASTRRVRTGTLDEALGPHSYALAKLDVEGHETASLRGARDRLAAADPPVWQVEVLDHQLARAGSDRSELTGLLADAGFQLATFTEDAGLRYLGPEDRPVGNIWAVHRSAVERVAERLAGN